MFPCRKGRGKGMREEIGSHESGEEGGNLEHPQFSMGLTITQAKKKCASWEASEEPGAQKC